MPDDPIDPNEVARILNSRGLLNPSPVQSIAQQIPQQAGIPALQQGVGNLSQDTAQARQRAMAAQQLGIQQQAEIDAKKKQIEQQRQQTDEAFIKDTGQIAKDKKDAIAGLGQEPSTKPSVQQPQHMNPQEIIGAVIPLMFMATRIGGKVGLGSTSAISALAAGLKGLKEGDDKAYQEGMDKYKESIAQAKADNDLYQRKLKSIVEDAKTTYSEKDRQVRLLDIEYGKQISELDKESRDLSTRVMQMTNQALAADKSLVNATKAEITVKLQADKAFESQKQANSAEAKQEIKDFSAQRATGEPMMQILAGYGGKYSPEIRKEVAEGAIVLISKEMGISHAEAAKELAARDQAYKAGNSAEIQLTKMLGSTYQAVYQLKYNVNEVKRQLKEVPSTDLAPVLNAIARKQEEWTGDPKLNSLYYNLDGAMLEAERLQSGAQASVAQLHEGAAQRAKEWLEKRWTTPAQFENLGNAMVKEGDARLNSFRSAIKQMRVGGDDSATPNSSPASSGGEQSQTSEPQGGSSLPSGWSVKQVK